MTPMSSIGTPQHSPANSGNIALPQGFVNLSRAPSYGKQLSVEAPQFHVMQHGNSRLSQMSHASDYNVMDSGMTPMGPLADDNEDLEHETPLGPAPGLPTIPQLPSEDATDEQLLEEDDGDTDDETDALNEIYNKPMNSKTAGGGAGDVMDEEEEIDLQDHEAESLLMNDEDDEGGSDSDDGVDDGLYGKSNVETKF